MNRAICDRVLPKNFIFYSALLMYLFAKNLELTSAFHYVAGVPMITNVFRYAAYLLILVKFIFFTEYKQKELLKIIAVVAVLFVTARNVGTMTLFYSFMFVIAAKDVDSKYLIRNITVFQGIITTLIAIASLGGIIPDLIYTIEQRYRHSLGYGYPNTITAMFFYFVLGMIYCIGTKIKLIHVLLLEAVNILVFKLTDTRTVFLLVSGVLLCSYLCNFFKHKLKDNFFSRLVYQYSVVIIPVIAVASCFLYNSGNAVWVKINTFLNNRIVLGHDIMQDYPITLLGQKIKWVSFGGIGYTVERMEGKYNYVDDAYMKILIEYGVVVLLGAILAYTIFAGRMIREGNRRMCLILLFSNAFNLLEPRYLSLEINFLVCYLWVLVCNKSKKKSEVVNKYDT